MEASSSSSLAPPPPPPPEFAALEYMPIGNDSAYIEDNDPPDVEPPSYEEARKAITTTVTYTFSQLTFNSMILLPPADSPDTRPLYHITISMNCFMPSSYITTVTRGGNENGEIVGDFEMGIVDKTSTVFIRGKEYKLNEVLSKGGPRVSATWAWFPSDPEHKVLWETSTAVSRCYKVYKENGRMQTHLLATFHHAPIIRRRSSGRVVLPQLEVEPKGQKWFDDILMALLVVERKRLSPTFTSDAKQLFN